MSEQHPTQTAPEPQTPDYAPEHFVTPDGYFDGLTERSLPTMELGRRHKAAARREEWHAGRADGADEAIENHEKSDAVRASNVFATASILNKRGVTDPHRTTSDAEVPRAPEDAFSRRYGLGKFMGILMAKHSVESPNHYRRARVHEGQGGRPATNELSAWQRRQSVSNAKSNFKQQVRQARSAATESTFSAGSGVGKRARTRTAFANHKEKSLLRESLAKGYISPEDYLIGKKHISMSEETTVPVRAVRRDVRRERLGGAVNIARADQPVRAGVRRTLKKRAETVQEKSSAKAEQHYLERTRLREELDRRAQLAQDEQAARASRTSAA